MNTRKLILRWILLRTLRRRFVVHDNRLSILQHDNPASRALSFLYNLKTDIETPMETRHLTLRCILLNLLCVAVGTALAAVCADAAPKATVIFILLLIWLCNELWNRVMAFVGIAAYIRQICKQNDVNQDFPRRLVALTSFILLLAPNLLFVILYGVNILLGNQLSEAIGLPFSHAFFACAYAAVVLLWMMALFGVVYPLSLEMLFSYFFEAEESSQPSDEQIAKKAAAAPGSPAAENEWEPAHPKLRELLPELLYYGRPNLTVTNTYARRDRNFGLIIMLFAVPFFSAASYLVFLHFPLLTPVPVILLLFFSSFAWRFIRMPRLWRQQLSRAEFAFTKTQIYITDGDELLTFDLNPGLHMLYEEVEGDVATILFDHINHHKNPLIRRLMQFFMKFGETVNTTSKYSVPRGPLHGFYQIDNAAQVYMQLKQLRGRD